MLPPFADGVLPEGIHLASLDEIRARFGWNGHRRQLLGGLTSALRDLKEAGCGRAWLDGSFVTEKELPGDFDLCWDLAGVDLDLLAGALQAIDPPRDLQKAAYGGDILPNVMEGGSGMPFLDFFQRDEVTGRERGIVEISLEVEEL